MESTDLDYIAPIYFSGTSDANSDSESSCYDSKPVKKVEPAMKVRQAIVFDTDSGLDF